MTETAPEISALEAALDAEESRLRAEAAAAFERVTRKPTGENRKALKVAEVALAQFLKDRHEPEIETTFKGLPEVLSYLEEEGWKRGKSRLYDDFNEGKIKAEKDGSFRLSSVLDYCRVHLQKKDGTKGGEAVSIQAEKQMEETLRIRTDRQLRELRLKEARGELVPRSEMEIQLSHRAQDLSNYFDFVFRSAAVRMIKLVGGDPQKAPELINFLLGMKRKALDNYSRPMEVDEDEE